MHENSMRMMKGFRNLYIGSQIGLTILDVGSMLISGQKDTYRQLFEPTHDYVGMDIAPGPNVDIVGFDKIPGVYDIVISGQVMEHVKHPWDWLKNLKRYFRMYICIIAPNRIHEHRYPIDTYRYYPDGMRDLFDYAGIVPVEIRRVGSDTIGVGVPANGL